MPNPHIPVNPRMPLSIQWSGCVELPSVHPRHAARTIRGGDQRTFMVEQPILRRLTARHLAQQIAACPDHVRPHPAGWIVQRYRPAANFRHRETLGKFVDLRQLLQMQHFSPLGAILYLALRFNIYAAALEHAILNFVP